MIEILKNTNYNFLGFRNKGFVISATLILVTFASIIYHGGFNLSVDFAGGISHDVLLSEQDNPGIASCLDDSSGHNYCQVVSMAALGDRARFPCQV